MEHTVYKSAKAYPVPEELEPNIRYARILADSYSGPESEFTAIAQYIYHHQEAEAVSPHLSQCLRGIAIVEMHHLDMLGHCIRLLGMRPAYRYYRGNMSRYWSAGYVSYGCTVPDMLKTDICGEREAIAHYKTTIQRIPEPKIQALLQRIIEDEEIHIQLLEGLQQSL